MTTPESYSSAPPEHTGTDRRGERLHRTDAAREAPIRSVFATTTNGTDTSSTTSDNSDKLAYGVDLGYQVINEQIAKAKDLAAQWRGPDSGSSANGGDGDWRHIASRMLHAYQDLGSVCLDAVQKLVDTVTLEETATAKTEERATPHTVNTTGLLPTNVAVRMRTSILAEADLKLNPGCGNQLAVAALHGPVGTTPVTHCVFAARDTHQIELTIEVPPATPEGVYSGVVVDTRTNEPCGTLCLRVGKD